MKEKYNLKKESQKQWVQVLALCFAGVLLNLLLSKGAGKLNLLLYLDTVGTVLVSVLGGYLPGILVGFVTNLIKGMSDSSSIYYGVLNVMMAVFASFAARRGYLKKIHTILLTIFVLTLIGGGLGTLLPWLLDDIVFESESLSAKLYETGIFGHAGAYLTANLLIDAADKAVTVVLALLILRLLPEKIKDALYFRTWKQAPLSKEMMKAGKNIHCRAISLRTRLLLMLTAALLAIGIVATIISFVLFRNASIDEHIRQAQNVTDMVEKILDVEKVEEYLEKGEQTEGYSETKEKLELIRSSSVDIEYVYVYRIQEDGCHVVFDLDTEDMEGSKPGEIVEFDESFYDYLPALLAGEPIEPIISNDSYGWLLTVYKPIYDNNGICQCYAAADVSMSRLAADERNFFVGMLSLFLGFFILIFAAGWWIAEYDILTPINTMALSVGNFAYNSEETRHESIEKIQDLDIRTGDEIENLYQAYVKMASDSLRYVADIQKKTDTISKMQNALIMVLADMVENRDQNTGDHVRKTAAYTRVIMKEMQKKGYYADQLTDEFVEIVANSAPLHDVGKIKVSDTILNKPGKLTDEEFAIMKSHTTAGSEVISQAIELVPDSEFLYEAKNLAQAHHEKWDGSGYPYGLSGEDIPLSARIMAVADVFDALVSRRSYKDPFPFEKAMDIIREGAGHHFDPKVADAFLSAEEEVRKVTESFRELNEGEK